MESPLGGAAASHEHAGGGREGGREGLPTAVFSPVCALRSVLHTRRPACEMSPVKPIKAMLSPLPLRYSTSQGCLIMIIIKKV